jgi:hypothetical protein
VALKRNNMKQTAVEWLIEEIHKNMGVWIPQHIQEQAKEMEKQQIIDAWIVSDNPLQRMEAEKYYNVTYKQD